MVKCSLAKENHSVQTFTFRRGRPAGGAQPGARSPGRAARGAQPETRPYFHSEEIGRHQHIHMTVDKLSPGRLLLAIAGRGQPVSLQDIRNRCITHPVSKILQSAGNPLISLAGRPAVRR